VSVCIVAQYPWRAVATLIGAEGAEPPGFEPPGLIMCSDTLVVKGQSLEPFDFLLAKQYGLSRNLIVCYTSSNVDGTMRALLRCAGTSNVKRLGSILRECHTRYGGATELLACVWSTGGHAPQILEVMPPSYEPRPRTGIVGIGDRKVLKKFKDVFTKEVEHILKVYVPPSEPFGNRFSIGSAIGFITAALSDAIEEAKSPTVALPVHTLTITKRGYSPFQALERSAGNPGTWRPLTTQTEKLSILEPIALRVPKDFAPRKAVQLFD
jgi:hypothetical protein